MSLFSNSFLGSSAVSKGVETSGRPFIYASAQSTGDQDRPGSIRYQALNLHVLGDIEMYGQWRAIEAHSLSYLGQGGFTRGRPASGLLILPADFE